MIKAEEIPQLVKEKEEKDFQELYSKMDEDYDLWSVKRKPFDTHPMAINITSNDPRSLFEKVQAYLTGSKPQYLVLPPSQYPSEEAEKAANAEELLYRFCFDQGDIRLRRILQPKLLDSLAWHILARGMSPARILIYEDNKGNIVYDFMALDARYSTFEIGRDGFQWYAHKTFRNPKSLQKEYRVDLSATDQRGVEVIDWWDTDQNIILTTNGQQLQKSFKHGLGEPPILMGLATTAPRVTDPNSSTVASWGQSIFAPNRLEYKQLDMLQTIEATHAHVLAKTPIAFESEPNSPPFTLDPKEIPYEPGATMVLPPGVRAVRLPVADIPRSLETAIGLSRGRLQRATYSDIEYGQLSFQLSGTALRMLKAEIDKVVGPRLRALASLYTDACLMMKKQILKQNLTIPVRTIEKANYAIYNMAPELLDNDFYVTVDLVFQEGWEEIENYQHAQMAVANRLMSRRSAMSDILKLRDVPKELELMNVEEVESQNPELKLWKAMKYYEQTGQEQELGIVAQGLQQGVTGRQAGIEGAAAQAEIAKGGIR